MKYKPVLHLLTLLLATGLLLSACATLAAPQPTATSSAIQITDGLKRPVTLSKPAIRIVSLAPSNTEILFAIGAGSQVVGRDEFSDYPAEAKSLPSVGGSLGKYNSEAIVNLKPDLVLAAEINPPELVKSLQDLGLNVFWLSNPTDLNGMYQNLAIVGQLTGHTAEAATLVASLKARVTAVTEKITPISARPSVFYELDVTDPNAPYTSGPGTFIDLLIQMAGGTNIGGSLKSAWAQLSLEKLVSLNPQVILLGDAAYGQSPDMVGKRAGWADLAAVKNGRIYAFDDNLASRPGPRLVDGLETLARLLHPGVFQ
jgi:iron complex transport system substrate-binding protein